MLTKFEIVDRIRYEHRKRCFLIKQRVRIGNALGAFVRTQLGWSLSLPEADRDRIKKQAETIIAKRGKDTEFEWIIAANDAACAHFDQAEESIKKALVKLVRQLPVWAWAKGVVGLGELGVSVIVGEAGDLSDYPKKGHLYKRMGVGMVGDIRQGGLPAGAPAAAWIEHGYNRERRARLYGFIGTALLKQGPYREAYLKRKAYEVAKVAPREVVPAAKIPKARAAEFVSEMCIHRRAQRYMEQRLLKHILQAWKRCDEGSIEGVDEASPMMPTVATTD